MYTLMLVAFMTKPEEVYQLWSEVIVVSNTVTILVTKNDEVVNEDQPLVQGKQGHLKRRKLNSVTSCPFAVLVLVAQCTSLNVVLLRF